MYESFFGFVNRPFIASPSLERYFPSSAIEQTVQTATRAIARAEGPIAIFGGSGLGKTVCCLRIAEYFRHAFDVISLNSSALVTRRALLQNLLYELKLPYRDMSEGELRLSLVNRLQPSPESANDGVLLMIDEAQVLPFKLLDEIRLLTNIQRNGLPRVRLVLCGNLKLEESLCHPQMDSLNQRLSSRCYLTPLSREETARYVVHKIELGGVNHQTVITADALEALYRGSDGIPRLIDQLADQAMLIAANDRVCPVNANIVGKAWGMLQQLPNPWCETDTLPKSATQMADVVGSGANPIVSNATMSVDTNKDLPNSALETQQQSSIEPPKAFNNSSALNRLAQSSENKSSIIEFGDLDDGDDIDHEEIENFSDRDLANQTLPSDSVVDTPLSESDHSDSFSNKENRRETEVTQSIVRWSDDSVEEFEDVPTINKRTVSKKKTVSSKETSVESMTTQTESKPVGKQRNIVVSTTNVFGDDFEQEYEIPLHSQPDLNSLPGIAFGQLNHDLEHFQDSSNSLDYAIEEAENFLEVPAPPTVTKESKDKTINAKRLDGVGIDGDDFSQKSKPHIRQLGQDKTELGGIDQLQNEWEQFENASYDSPISYEVDGYRAEAFNYDYDAEPSLEEMVEEEMRELVSELNLSAMAFDPTQIIVELEPNDDSPEDESTLSNEESMLGRRAYIQMRDEWNEGNVFVESSRPVASDDRDMLVIEDDAEGKPTPVPMTEVESSLPKPVLHPYAKLFSNLRKS